MVENCFSRDVLTKLWRHGGVEVEAGGGFLATGWRRINSDVPLQFLRSQVNGKPHTLFPFSAHVIGIGETLCLRCVKGIVVIVQMPNRQEETT